MFAIRAERDYVVEEDFMKAARYLGRWSCKSLMRCWVTCVVMFHAMASSRDWILWILWPILTILQGKIADNKKLEGKLDYEKI